MKNTDIFDVLVVYSGEIANSASLTQLNGNTPFPTETKYEVYNDVYSYFLSECKKRSLSAALTTSNDIIGPGKCKSYWVFQNNEWIPVKNHCYSQKIFDKFAPINSKQVHNREVLFSQPYIKSFTDPYLLEVFSDKQLTYDLLSEYSIPTVTIKDRTPEAISEALDDLKEIISTHPFKDDFKPNYILKDKMGAGGSNIFKIDDNYKKNISTIMNKNKKVSFILQPFVSFDKGFKFKDFNGHTEIRLIYKGEKVAQTYVRVANEDDYVCNYGSGGLSILKKDIPLKVLKVAKQINKQLDRKNAIYALDFIITNNNNVFLLEANISPGIDWHPENMKNVKMNQKMIRVMIDEISRRLSLRYKGSLSLPEIIENQSQILQPTKEVIN